MKLSEPCGAVLEYTRVLEVFPDNTSFGSFWTVPSSGKRRDLMPSLRNGRRGYRGGKTG